MDKIKLLVEFELTGEGEIDADAATATVDEISGHIKNSVEDDFGEQAWGGYDGLTAKNVTVNRVES